jgi:hypothetical protein
MSEFKINVVFTVNNVESEREALAVVQKMLQAGGISKQKITHFPIPGYVVESEPR